MNNFEFLIIYLTCGAPLGVFYFLRNYKKQNGIQVGLKTFLTFVFWLPFGFQLLKKVLRKKLYTTKKPFTPINDESKILSFQKQLEEVLRLSNLPISIFEFREVFERYVELTIAADYKNADVTEAAQEIFQIAGNENVTIGSICLNRRNLKRLIVHQNKARQDFFQITGKLVEMVSDRNRFAKSATDFFTLLKDNEAKSVFNNFSFGDLTVQTDFTAANSDYFLWKTETHNSQPTPKLLSLTTATNLSVKD